MNVRNAESAMIAGKAVIADNAGKVGKIETIPERSDENSLALQCWVRIVPTRSSRRDARNVQMWALSGFREIENDPSSLSARITVKNGVTKHPAITESPSVTALSAFPPLSYEHSTRDF